MRQDTRQGDGGMMQAPQRSGAKTDKVLLERCLSRAEKDQLLRALEHNEDIFLHIYSEYPPGKGAEVESAYLRERSKNAEKVLAACKKS